MTFMTHMLCRKDIRDVEQSPLDDDTEKKLPAKSPQNEMSNLEF